MLKKGILAALVVTGMMVGSASAMSRPVTIEDQGSFLAGGTVVTAPGKYDGTKPMNLDGETLHGDHAYVFYQKPVKAHKYGLVFLHGAGQSAKTWETTPDGRDGFQNIFLERGYSTYLVDQPRRGKAGRSTVAEKISAVPDDQLWYNTFRIGQWPDYYENAQVPRDKESLDQFFRQMTPNTGAYNDEVIAAAMADVFEKSGDGVLVTHSQGGGPGWYTAIKTDKVRGIVAMEPGAFLFPEGEVPEVEATSSPFPAKGVAVPVKDFLKLTKIPIVVYYGDNIPSEPTDNWGQDNWRVRLNLARKWAAAINRYGGDAKIVHLPKVGIYGNTHFLFADLNNVQIADLIEKWMKVKGLAK